MATSGTYTYNPSLGELGLWCFNACGIRSTALTAEHMENLRMSANLLLSDWSNKGPNLWAIDLVTVPLVQGTATYSVDPSTVMILDMYYQVSTGSATTNRIILPVSRTEYASYPNPSQQGAPTTFWFDRLEFAPTFSLYPTPDGNEQSLQYYRVRRLQDSNLSGGQNPEVPYIWLNAFAYGLAEYLAIAWAPDKVPVIAAYAQKAYNAAATQGSENVQMYISPQVYGYWRQ